MFAGNAVFCSLSLALSIYFFSAAQVLGNPKLRLSFGFPLCIILTTIIHAPTSSTPRSFSRCRTPIPPSPLCVALAWVEKLVCLVSGWGGGPLGCALVFSFSLLSLPRCLAFLCGMGNPCLSRSVSACPFLSISPSLFISISLSLYLFLSLALLCFAWKDT